jgi:hypothetical protein
MTGLAQWDSQNCREIAACLLPLQEAAKKEER